MYLQLSQAPAGATTALSTQTLHPPKFTHPVHPLFSNRRPKFLSTTTSTSTSTSFSNHRSVIVNADITNKSKPTTSLDQPISVVSQENVPLEGVIQFEKPDTTSRFRKWGHVALLSGGDVLAILLFSAIGRFSHGFPVFEAETLRTADPFIAGWFLSAYFLGGYGDDGRGLNGKNNAIIAAVKSWALGVPVAFVTCDVTSFLRVRTFTSFAQTRYRERVFVPTFLGMGFLSGYMKWKKLFMYVVGYASIYDYFELKLLGILTRATSIGHIPPTRFIAVTLGSTALLLIGWRAIISSILADDKNKKNDVYKRGNPFELFELLTSLVRRW